MYQHDPVSDVRKGEWLTLATGLPVVFGSLGGGQSLPRRRLGGVGR